jgi:hypothetical protein
MKHGYGLAVYVARSLGGNSRRHGSQFLHEIVMTIMPELHVLICQILPGFCVRLAFFKTWSKAISK